ncbi:eukaryotic translation initiation factor 5B-like isoform X1 [Solanum pennellii]|uniref:Eukaryotic translation initiation factor 5B n=1 Tax=Solanum pennellii TaxID=28526 RepID=A0ABM1GE03_SOLPN|nr:eukaryotic translation initiation factor 5B-like isoform X1 [Solanum pennellii]
MGRKKTTEENPEPPKHGGGGGKSKKKNRVIDDDEYSVQTEEPTVQEDTVLDDDERKKPAKQGGGKSRKKNVVIDDDEYTVATEEPVVLEEKVILGGKKKAKKGKKGASNYGEDLTRDNDQEDEGIAPFSGKLNKSKQGKARASVFSTVFDTIGDEESEEDIEPVVAGGMGKTIGNSFSVALLDEEEEADTSVSKFETETVEEDDAPELIFAGKKKSSKKKKKIAVKEEDEPEQASQAVNPEEEADDDESKKQQRDVPETSKNKTKKKKGGRTVQEDEDEIDKILAELGEEAAPAPSEEKVQTQLESKDNKSKKKKSGRTAQEEDDIDKILAEIGEGPPATSAPTPSSLAQEEKGQLQPQLGDAAADKEAIEEGAMESAAAKKKKKKKEKEKEKKAAAAASSVEEKQEETKNDAKGKLADKKQSKQVREMQERLKKMKETEERKKREEEEKLRKEEEERRLQEELEKLAEEKKRLKKEREKEKLLKKKQEGKLLTGKQKEEARRLEAMRKQFLANGGTLPTGENKKETTKRPIYQTKKSKPQAQANDKTQEESIEISEVKEHHQEIVSEVDSVETEKVEDVDSTITEEKSEIADAEENEVEEEEEDDEEWDAKSWDDADLKLPGKSAFEDDEVDSEPQPITKKEIKVASSAVHGAATLPVAAKSVIPTQKTAATVTGPLKNDRSRKGEPEDRNVEQNKQKGSPEEPGAPNQNEDNLRSPICCIMGHVDTGKTKLLDCIRGTNVQEGEAGGITQQIGATYFPAENIRERTKELKADAKLKVPGLLVIDTPGHESFTNLRSRGSGLCDIAILVVDIMHGLEPQTIESLNLLKMRNTEFIVALNKVDRLYGWKVCKNAPIVKAMKQQSKDVQFEYNTRLTQIVTQFKEQGINTELYYKNKEMGKDSFSIVPTSAISGEGIPDMLLLLVQWTQKTMIERLTYSNVVQCTVLEVKVVEGHGTTIDVVLVNGVLHEGDQIVVCGMQGPIVTTIRALLTPHPMKELRVKGTYLHHKKIKAAQGIKITAQGFEHAIAGTSLYVVGPDDDVEDIKEAAMEDMKSVMSRIDKSGEGVYVQASTLGSLEALLEFLKTPEVSIPVSGIGIGPVHKKDVMKASVMLEKKKEYATILAFDVKVTQEARELSDELGVKVFMADIIYHLFDQFKAYIDTIKEEKKKEVAEEAVFPCVLKIVPNCVFNKKDPIVLGVDVLEGIVRIGSPICIPQKEFIDIGRIASIENNHKPVDSAKKGQRVAIKIVGFNPEEQQKMFGRHFEMEDELVSKISRRSIDILKANFRKDLSVEDWRLVMKLKTLFKIQ